LAIAHPVEEAMQKFVGSLSDEAGEALVEMLELAIIFGTALIAYEVLEGITSLAAIG
jgi:hypothetical protein